MKMTSKTALALALAVATAGFAAAQSSGQSGDQQGPPPQRDGMHEGQGPGHGMPSPEEHLKHLTEALNLTADQQTQIKGFMESGKKQMDALRNDASLTQEQRHEQAQKVHESTHASIRGVLTAEQQTKFDKMQAEMKNHHGPHGPGHNGDGHQDPSPPPPAD